MLTIKVFNLPAVKDLSKTELNGLKLALVRLAEEIREFKVKDLSDMIIVANRTERSSQENVLVEISGVDCSLEIRKKFAPRVKSFVSKFLLGINNAEVKVIFLKHSSEDTTA